MEKFEWYGNIKSQKDFEEYTRSMEKETGINYEQVARLFYQENGKTVMVELQVPTKDMLDVYPELPWLDVYSVKSLDDYDASNEICTTCGWKEVINFENAKEKMLKYAKELINQ